jgi:micrococcal nuclease
MRRLLRIVIVLAVLVAIVMAWTRRSRGGATDVALPDAPVVASRAPTTPSTPAPRWCDPVDGACPPGYEIKAKLSSGIFHEPGMVNYARTTPDRCYASADAAVADGLRPAKR